MFKNEYTLNVDIKRKFTALVPTFVQNDTATLKFKIFNNGLPYDLSSFTNAEVTTQRKDGNIVIGKAYIEGSVGNQYIRYEYLGNEMAESGFAQTTLTIFSDTTRVSILPFKINIVADIRDAIGASEEYGVLQDLIVRVEDVLDNIGSVVDNANQAVDSANQAVIDANQAIIDADNAVSLATANATLANEAANNADAKAIIADSAAINANSKATLAEEKAQLADSAATNANNAILGIDEATSNANQATINANNAAQNTNDAIANVNTTIDTANDAIFNANQATSDAQIAIQNTVQATSDAVVAKQDTEQAISNANTATSNASTATTNANKATTEANLAKDGALMAIASATTATQNANTSATNAQTVADNTNSQGQFVLGKAYKKNNLVLDNGSTWIALVNTQGNPLPVLPITENTYWRLVAQRGIDGEGSVSSVNGTFPDVNGNVTLDLGDSITMVDGFSPNELGNVITHANKSVLDKFSESNGNPQYNGNPLGAVESVNGQTGVVTGLETVANSDNKLSTKVDKVTGKQLSTEDFTAANKTKLTGIETGAQVNAVTSVNGATGAITGLETTVNADSKLTNKVDKVAGKQLSTEDYTSIEKTKLSNIADSANNYTHPTTAGNKHIPTGGATGNFLKYSASGTAVWSTPTSSDITESTTKKFVSDTKIAEWDAKATPEYVDNKTGILFDNIGDMRALETANITDLVKAINEINAKPTGGDTTEIAKQINTLYKLSTGIIREQAYTKLLQEASSRLDGGTVFAHDMNGNIIGMTLDEANSQNIVIRDGKMMMIAKSEVTKTITDATVVASAYDTSGNGGRKIVRLSNGWLVVVVKTTNFFYFYVDKQTGTGFVPLCHITTATIGSNDIAIASRGTRVHVVDGISTTGVISLTFEATTVPNINIYGVAPYYSGFVDSTQTAIGNVSLAINPEGTELHAVWSSKNATYPNSFNIRYAKGVISQVDGSVTWGTVEQVTTSVTATQDYTNPSIITISNGYPVFICSFNRSGTSRIESYNWNGSSFTVKIIYDGGAYLQSSPSAIFVPKSVNGLANGRIWVAWYGRDGTANPVENIRVSYSDDGGITWSAMQKVTNETTVCVAPTITADKNNNIYIVFGGVVSSKNQVRKIKNTTGTWGSITNVTNDVNGAYEPNALNSIDISASEPLFIYKGTSKVGFYGTWQEPVETPTLTAKAVYDIPSTDYVGAFIKKIGATTVQAYVNDVLTDAELVDSEYQFTKQLATEAPVKLRLELSRVATTGGENDAATRVLGGRS